VAGALAGHADQVRRGLGNKVVERILHNLSLLMDRSFKSVQELNRYRKELQATPGRRNAAPPRGVSGRPSWPRSSRAQEAPRAWRPCRAGRLHQRRLRRAAPRPRHLPGAGARLGGSLVVALNTDASARRLGKGPDRPLNGEQDRAMVIAALESVSLVTWFDEDTPVELLSELKPQVYVKGGDYDMRKLARRRWWRATAAAALAIPVRRRLFDDGAGAACSASLTACSAPPAEADDVLQDAWLRWNESDTDSLRSPRPGW
jgi:rfaE bifunctional protein nucleotidyltransferase chain/domain